MRQFLIFSLLVCLMVIFWACSDDSNPVQPAASRVFDPSALWDTASTRLGGNVQSLAARDSFVFAGTSDSGVFVSTNNGTTWVKRINGLSNLSVAALFVNDTNLFAGTTGGIFVSGDNGLNWGAVASGPANAVNCFVRKDTNLYAGVANGAWRSVDGGINWTARGMVGQNVRAFALRDSSIFAATSGGVWRTNDDGANWATLNTNLPSANTYALAIKDTNIFVATFASGVYRTSNDSSWVQANDGLNSVIYTGARATSFFVYRSGILVGFNNYQGVYLTLTNGASWFSCNAGLPVFFVNAFVYNGTYLFVGGINQGAGGGVWRHPL